MPEERWSEPERWAWEEIRAARTVDFSMRDGHDLDPKVPDGWHEGRRLGSSFLSEILFHDPYREAIPFEGVQINGACLTDILVLSYTRVNRPLHLRKCRFEKGADFSFLRTDDVLSLELSAFAQGANSTSLSLRGVRVEGHLAMVGATIAGTLAMEGLEVERNLFMQGLVASEQINLLYARVGGQLSMDGAKVTGLLDMRDLEVGHLFMRGPATFNEVVLGGLKAQDLQMDGATFQNVNAVGGRVGGQLSMNGAMVADTLNMSGLKVDRLSLIGTFKNINLTSASVSSEFDITDASVSGSLNMNSLSVGQSLLMYGRATFKDVNLVYARIAGQLAMDGSKVAGALNMNGLEIGKDLLMRGGTFQDVNLAGARVAGTLSMDGATVTKALNLSHACISRVVMVNASVSGRLDMNDLKARHLFMHRGATFKDVNLVYARIAGQLAMDGSKVTGTLNMSGVEVGQDLLMRNASLQERINLTFGCIGSSLNLSGSELSELDLSGARIEGYLRLASDPYPMPRWGKNAQLNLRAAHAGVLADRLDKGRDAWPNELHLNGFTYGLLGGMGGGATSSMLTRDAGWYIDWLARDPSYSPQPYQQLAAVFEAAGAPTEALRIRYEGRERARRQAKKERLWRLPLPGWRWIGLTLLKCTIGYGLGLRYFRVLYWIVPITLIGMGFLLVTCQGPEGVLWKMTYSLDLLLPVIQLDEAHSSIPLSGWVKVYFYVHKVVGWLLASFLVAGLAGLTQK